MAARTIRNNKSRKASPAPPENQSGSKAQIIHLGIDVHLRQYVVCRKLDGATPQPAQRFKSAEFIGWARKQLALAGRVVCCYEAGPLGYTLQRELAAAGITAPAGLGQAWQQGQDRRA